MNSKISLLVSALLVSSIALSACTNKAENTEVNPEASQKDSGVTNVAFPLKEKVTLKAVAHRPSLAPSDFNNQPLLKSLEAQTNVQIKWDTIVESDFIEKRNILLASRNLPDFFFSGRFSDSELIRYAKDGTIIPLNDLIEKHMPNLKAILDSRPDIKAQITAPDGSIYALPNGEEIGSGQQEIVSNPNFIYINKAWLDKLQLKMPTTMDEYTEVLRAFKKGDPNGNGKADEIPLTYIDNFWTGDIGILFGAFGVPDKTHRPNNPTYIDHLNVVNGKVQFAPQQEGYKKAAAYLHQWFKEDLVDKDAFTHNYETYFARGKTKDETLGSLIWWDKNDVTGPERGEHWVLVPPFKDMVIGWNNGGGFGRDGVTITSANKNKEITAAWLDSFYDPVFAAQSRFGPIGVWFDKDSSGKLIQKEVKNPGETRQSTAISNGIGMLLTEHTNKVDYIEPRATERIKDNTKLYIPQMEKEKFPNLFFNEEELNTIDKLKPDISSYVNKMRAKWLLNGGVEQEWNEHQETLKKMGIEKLLEVHQSAYDRYVKAKK
ncbi:type 2 periplasmic-binding domain-containing protein [Paenibacillus puerhi]|uniref:extracellular solute-binding protein n=1 Tax=Paenibacillus puerhi TaxID=2692622 RepID=UPI0013573A7A|nr:extracellular solute-binding protein [Paenibacillus puerhi]